MNRNQLLTEAAKLISGDRARQYGDAAAAWDKVAALWSAFLGVPISAVDALHMMALLKVSRAQTGRHHPDNWVDLLGYSALAGEVAGKRARNAQDTNPSQE